MVTAPPTTLHLLTSSPCSSLCNFSDLPIFLWFLLPGSFLFNSCSDGLWKIKKRLVAYILPLFNLRNSEHHYYVDHLSSDCQDYGTNYLQLFSPFSHISSWLSLVSTVFLWIFPCFLLAGTPASLWKIKNGFVSFTSFHCPTTETNKNIIFRFLCFLLLWLMICIPLSIYKCQNRKAHNRESQILILLL